MEEIVTLVGIGLQNSDLGMVLYEWEYQGKTFTLLPDFNIACESITEPPTAEEIVAGFNDCAVELYKLKQAYAMVLEQLPDAVE